jgi:hypothetical protein
MHVFKAARFLPLVVLVAMSVGSCNLLGGGDEDTDEEDGNENTVEDDAATGGDNDTREEDVHQDGTDGDGSDDDVDEGIGPAFPDFGFEVAEGDFWEFDWEYSEMEDFQQTVDQSGTFWLQLGASRTIEGITLYAVDFTGEAQREPIWQYIGTEGNTLYGSTDGSSLLILFDGEVGAGVPFFASTVPENLLTARSGSISNDIVSDNAINLGNSFSQSKCEYYPGVGTICTGDYDSSYYNMTYYKRGVGPFGLTMYDSYVGEYSQSQQKHEVGLVACSLWGDVFPGVGPGSTITTYDFEGGLIPDDFAHSGDASWTIDASTAGGGVYSIRSGSISHNQVSEITLSGTVSTGATLTVVSFDYRRYSESAYDILTFLVNGTAGGEWSGYSTWKRHSATMSISGGSDYELTWRYQKDGSGNYGEDAVWVDTIELGFN